MQTDVEGGSGCSIKLLFCILLGDFAVLSDFILQESEDRKVFIVQGCQWALCFQMEFYGSRKATSCAVPWCRFVATQHWLPLPGL